MIWGNIDEVYEAPKTNFIKGNSFHLKIQIDREIDQFEKTNLGQFVNAFYTNLNNRNVKPFKALDTDADGCNFYNRNQYY